MFPKKKISQFYFKILGTPDAPSVNLRVDNEPFTISKSEKLAVVSAGQMIEMKCTSEGAGNPVTSLTLTKNGTSFGPEPRSFLNTHTFMATKNDNGAFLGCKAENENNWHAESWPIELNVLCKLHEHTTIHIHILERGKK